MKKQVLIGSVLLAAISAFSQNGQSSRPKPTGMINIKALATTKFGVMESTPTVKANSLPVKNQKASKSAATNTWNSFTSSMNLYGVVIPYTKPLQWNDELNAVTFVHRKSPSYVMSPASAANAASGGMVAMISTNCGTSWDSTAVYANDNFWGRYPGGAIYNPPGNTNINNAYIVAAGPATGNGAATWIGNFYASKQLGTANYNNAPSTVPNAQQTTSSAGPYTPSLGRHDFSAYGFTATDDGKVRVLAGVTDDGLTADTAITLVTGTFNNGVFDWAGTVFNPPTTVDGSDNTENWVSRPMMAWNEQGTVGYVVVMGQRLGTTGSNMGFQPIVYKTVNSGATWSLESGIDFNTPAFADVIAPLIPVGITNVGTPNFMWTEGIDCSVDANNKLHIFSSILGHASSHPDSLNFINQFTSENYLWAHVPGARPYLYDFIYDGTNASPSWSHILVDSMSTEGPSGAATGAGYQDNPWDQDPSQSNQKVRIDARIQMSRTPDGKYMVYTWGESDTLYTPFLNKWNSMPNVKARVLNVTTGALSPVEVDVTVDGGPNVSTRAWFHIVSPKCKFISDDQPGTNVKVGPILQIPMTVTSSDPYSQLTANTHWYSCATVEFTLASTVNPTVGISENNINSVNNSNIFPNPAKTNATLQMNLATASKVQVEVLNTMGQSVKTAQVSGQVGTNNINIDLDGLPTGIYFVKVKVNNATNTKKLVIE